MLAVALIKLLTVSIAMVGLIRLVVIVCIGDAKNDLAIRRLIHIAKRARTFSKRIEPRALALRYEERR